MHPVATYLSELRATRASGQATKELSYYAPLRALLSAAGKQLDPSGEHFEVTAGWGYIGHHGATTYDVFLNEVAYWRNVPARVWDYTLGGYPVLKKWLSYREKDVLGRGLKLEEVKHLMHMARRIAALLLLEPALDENYARSKVEEEALVHGGQNG